MKLIFARKNRYDPVGEGDGVSLPPPSLSNNGQPKQKEEGKKGNATVKLFSKLLDKTKPKEEDKATVKIFSRILNRKKSKGVDSLEKEETELFEVPSESETIFFAPSPYFNSKKIQPKKRVDLPKGCPSKIKGVIITESSSGDNGLGTEQIYSKDFLVRNRSRVIVVERDPSSENDEGDSLQKKDPKKNQTQLHFLGRDVSFPKKQDHTPDDPSTDSDTTADSVDSGTCTETTGDRPPTRKRGLKKNVSNKSLFEEVAEDIGAVTFLFVMDASTCIGMGCGGMPEATETVDTVTSKNTSYEVGQ